MTPSQIASTLTEAQRRMLIESGPGGFGRVDTACGAEVIGIGQLSTARSLERKGLGQVDWFPYAYPKHLYFSNSEGLSVREYLLTQDGEV